MDRRNFLQTLTALASTSPLAIFASEEHRIAISSKGLISPSETTNDLLQLTEAAWLPPKIGVIAIGSAGGAILKEQRANLPCLSRAIAIDTNPFGLRRTDADVKIQIGDGRKRYIEPTAARFLANAKREEIASAVSGLDLVFILAGMGGATGTGISPIVAEVTHDARISTIAATIIPFEFEGRRRQQIAEVGLRSISRRVNASIPLSNELFARSADDGTLIDRVLAEVPKAFTHLYRGVVNNLSGPGLVGIDFEDVRVVLSQRAGQAAFGFGAASGENSGKMAALNAIASPLLGQARLQKATAVLLTIEGRPEILKMREISNIMNTLNGVCPEALLMVGAIPNPTQVEDCSVTILANGIPLA